MDSARSRFKAAWLAAVWGMALSLRCLAAEPVAGMTNDFLLRGWQTDEGLPNITVKSITQTPDGFVWLGTYGGGLARFDGLHFEAFKSENTLGFSSDAIFAAFVDRQGRLVAATAREVLRLERGKWQAWRSANGWPGGVVPSLVEDGAGRLWATARTNELFQFTGERWIPSPAPDRPGDAGELKLKADASGTVWAWSDFYLGRHGDAGWHPALTTNELGREPIRGLGLAKAGGFWVATTNWVRRFDGQQWAETHQRPERFRADAVSLLEDSRGILWMGGMQNGLLGFMPDGRMLKCTRAEGLDHNSIFSLFEDREGNLLIGTDGGGLGRLKPRRVLVYDESAGLGQNIVSAVVEDAPGRLLVSSWGSGLVTFENGVFSQPITNKSNLKTNSWVYSAVRDHRGILWVSARDEGLIRMEGGTGVALPIQSTGSKDFRLLFKDSTGIIWAGGHGVLLSIDQDRLVRHSPPDASTPWRISCLAEDKTGKLWLGTNGDGLFVRNGSEFGAFSLPPSMARARLTALHVDRSGALWIGTADRMLARWSGSELFVFTTEHGLPRPRILSIQEDDFGRLWLGTDGGIICLDQSSLEAVAAGRAARIEATELTRSDGLSSVECSSTGTPNACKSSDGMLWFSNIKGLAMVDPKKFRRDDSPPPIHIVEAIIDGDRHHLATNEPPYRLEVPAGSRRMEIRYTAVNFAVPERVRFQYRLGGETQNWIDAGAERKVVFEDLQPREYRFEVRAASSDGVWASGPALAVRVRPLFTQTLWFRTAAVLALAVLAGVAAWSFQSARLNRQEERLRQELALARERARSAAVLEATSDFVAFADASGRVEFINNAGRDLLGLNGLTGSLNLNDLLSPSVSPQSREAILRTARDQGLWSGELEFRGREGRAAIVSLVVVGHKRREQIEFLSLVGRDMTRQKRSEDTLRSLSETLRLVTDTAPAYISYIDAQHCYRWVNRHYEKWFGLPREKLIGRPVREVMGETDYQDIAPNLNRALAGETVKFERVVPPPGGKPCVLDVTYVPDCSPDGSVAGVVVFVSDITDRRRAEEERAALDRKVQESAKLESLGVLAGGIAHDFNNILTSILGNANLARLESPSNSPQAEHLIEIERGTQRAAELCRQLLAYSGKGRLEVLPTDLSALVEDTTQLLNLSASKKVLLQFQLARNLPSVRVDAAQLRQVIINLVINASEAIGDREGIIRVTTSLRPASKAFLQECSVSPDLPEGDYVTLEVADNGCGMPAETKAHIFEPFFSTKFTGRGLGLSAVLGIVRGHQGAIRVDSQLDRGTTFTILLPPIHEAPAPLTPTLGTRSSFDGTGAILVVDDEPGVRTVTERILRNAGFNVASAGDGAEALRVFKNRAGEISLVLLDVTMPRMDGVETARELRRVRPDVRIILMSGYDERMAAERFSGLNVNGFMQKPFMPDELRSRIAAQFQR